SSAMVSGATSTEQTTSGSGAATTQPSSSADSKYCVPGSTEFCEGPVGEWNFEEKDGSVKDSSGNNNHGTLLDGATLGPGKHGAAGDFAASETARTVPIANNLHALLAGDGSFTAMAWIKQTGSFDYGPGQGATILGTRA